MGKDKYHPYQTFGDVLLGLVNPRKGPPVNQKQKLEDPEEQEEEQKKEKR